MQSYFSGRGLPLHSRSDCSDAGFQVITPGTGYLQLQFCASRFWTIASGMEAGEIFNMRGTPGLEPGIKNLAEFSVRIAVAISAEAAKHSRPG
jgi:hypothetical protein